MKDINQFIIEKFKINSDNISGINIKDSKSLIEAIDKYLKDNKIDNPHIFLDVKKSRLEFDFHLTDEDEDDNNPDRIDMYEFWESLEKIFDGCENDKYIDHYSDGDNYDFVESIQLKEFHKEFNNDFNECYEILIKLIDKVNELYTE